MVVDLKDNMANTSYTYKNRKKREKKEIAYNDIKSWKIRSRIVSFKQPNAILNSSALISAFSDLKS